MSTVEGFKGFISKAFLWDRLDRDVDEINTNLASFSSLQEIKDKLSEAHIDTLDLDHQMNRASDNVARARRQSKEWLLDSKFRERVFLLDVGALGLTVTAAITHLIGLW